MDRRVLLFLGMAMTLVLTAFPAAAFAQAAAESVLTHAGSATAAVKAGSAMNSALNRSSKQLAGRVQEQMSKSRPGATPRNGQKPEIKAPLSASAVGADSARQITVSIQGGEITCAPAPANPPANLKTETPQEKPNTEAKPTNCGSQHPARPQGLQAKDKYKPVITVSFPKE